MSAAARRVTLIGEVGNARHHSDRIALQRSLVKTLNAVNRVEPTNHPLRCTEGDEFRASYARRGQALNAILQMRARLNPEVDLRFGIGRGEVSVLSVRRKTEDGPGWWAAQDSLDWVKAEQVKTGFQAVRAHFAEASGWETTECAVNAAIANHDVIVADWDQRTWQILLGLLNGLPQAEVAKQLGISRQAVQQRRKTAHIPVMLSAYAWLNQLE